MILALGLFDNAEEKAPQLRQIASLNNPQAFSKLL
jgi:hypothetical protein